MSFLQAVMGWWHLFSTRLVSLMNSVHSQSPCYTQVCQLQSQRTFSLWMPCPRFYLHSTDMQPISQGREVESQRGDRHLLLRIPSTWKETANVGQNPPILTMHPKTEFRPILLLKSLVPLSMLLWVVSTSLKETLNIASDKLKMSSECHTLHVYISVSQGAATEAWSLFPCVYKF